jgi:membrane associated rhomboid family serine protease
VGASTAVFTALGLLAAHSWRLRSSYSQRWAVRWAPLVGGIVLLGWFGSGGGGSDGDLDAASATQVDVVAHATGFMVGCLLGALAAKPALGRLLDRVPQWIAGLAALGSIAIAWACALAT